jgi:hypothetical protein
VFYSPGVFIVFKKVNIMMLWQVFLWVVCLFSLLTFALSNAVDPPPIWDYNTLVDLTPENWGYQLDAW